ncbi:UV-endonuclease UvdE [Artomyces pyxidatus]|uniref:UV-endonuclease UvdE n=1 Tax=Artomyces pyxidatus TaxID=48021 RepID=A0ACB8T5G9_9AGAM|nr:UV-endonuclease UvdE [Artomyces pyxidatus]
MVGNRVKSRVAAVTDASRSARSAVPALEAPVERRTSARIRSKADAAVASTPLVVAQKEVSPSLLDEAPPKKRRRKTKDDRPTVYDILPVQQLTTTYRGRLGYACLNTILRATKPDPIFCSRTCRIDTILKNGLDFAKNLGLQNANDLCKLIQWNEDNQIKFLRISSEMFPFASHATYGYDLDYASAELKVAGDLAKSLGHRMTLHPGQFTQLGSPKENVVEASIRELQYHCSILNLMGMGKDSVIIIHMGGMYGDKPATLARFKENYTTKLSDDIKARLVLENDEMCYNADDLLPLCEELDIPIVFDYHHNWIFPSADPLPTLLPRINAIWHRKGIRPKQHLSSPRPGATTLMERRAHAGRCATLPDALQDEGAGWWRAPSGEMMWVDLMIEAKDKEQAVLQLYRTYGLAPVIWENLRPEEADRKKDKDEGAAGSTTRRTRKAAGAS